MSDILRIRPATQIAWLTEGRTPWEVFNDVGMIGNSRIDPCSRILRRSPTRNWIKAHCNPPNTKVYIGFGWDEEHRFNRSLPHWKPWTIVAPLLSPPYYDKATLSAEALELNILPPDMYARGYPHANCGGFCIKAGQRHFKHLLTENRDLFLLHEGEETKLREKLGKDVSVLTSFTKKVQAALTLKSLRERIEADQAIDEIDWGGCGCFLGDEEE